jgi:DNA polymerase-3 subunit delta
MKYNELKKEIQNKNFYPVYLFHGEEDFLKKEVIDEISESLVPKGKRSFNYNLLYGKDTTSEEIIDVADMLPVNAERRVVIVKEVQSLHASYKKKLIPYLKNPNPSTTLICVASERINERVKFYKTFKEKGCVVNFWTLFDNKIPDWIVGHLKKYGKRIDRDAAKLLQENAGNHLLSLANEIEKILIFIGDQKSITKKDVQKIVGVTKQETIFDLTDAVGNKDIKSALKILDRLLLNGVNGVYMIAMLTRHFSLLWRARAASKKLNIYDLAKELHQSPMYAKKYKHQCRNFSPLALAHCFEYLYEADLQLKSTSVNQKIIMENLVLNLCR